MKKAVLISCFDWYDKRLQPIADLFSKKFEVTILTSDFNHIDKSYIKKKRQNCEYLHVPEYKSNISLKRVISHLVFGKKVRTWLDKNKPYVVYLLLPPNNIAYHVLKYKRENPNVKYIIDVIDMWPESMPVAFMKKTKIYKIWKSLRDQSIKSADGVVVECNYYKKHIKTSCPIYTLYVLKRQTEREVNYYRDNIKKWIRMNIENIENNRIVLGYVGSINNIIDIDMIVNIINVLSKKYMVEINIIGDGMNKDNFIQQLERTTAKVVYHGVIFDEVIKMEILGKCNYGLNIMKDMVSVGLTIKSVDYFSYGLPVINNIKGDTWDMVEKENMGINVIGDNVINEITDDINWCVLRENIHKIYEHKFSVDSVINSVGDLLSL